MIVTQTKKKGIVIETHILRDRRSCYIYIDRIYLFRDRNDPTQLNSSERPTTSLIDVKNALKQNVSLRRLGVNKRKPNLPARLPNLHSNDSAASKRPHLSSHGSSIQQDVKFDSSVELNDFTVCLVNWNRIVYIQYWMQKPFSCEN